MSTNKPQTDLVVRKDELAARVAEGYLTRPQLDVLRKALMPKGSTDDELALFIEAARILNLNPFAGQIQAIRFERDGPVVPYTTWEGLVARAARIPEFEGMTRTFWTADGVSWSDVWVNQAPPAAAKVGVYRRGWREPVWGVCRFESFCRRRSDGKPMANWATMPDRMIAKSALRLALRSAFPHEMGREDLAPAGPGSETTDLPLTPAQLKALQAAAKSQGLDREARLALASEILRRTVESFTTLTVTEAAVLLDALDSQAEEAEIEEADQEPDVVQVSPYVGEPLRDAVEAAIEQHRQDHTPAAPAPEADESPTDPPQQTAPPPSSLHWLPRDLSVKLVAHFQGNAELAQRIVASYAERAGKTVAQFDGDDYTALSRLMS